MKAFATFTGLILVNLTALQAQMLDEDSLIHYYFNDKEVKQLQSIVDLFDEHVKRDCNRTAAECLAKYSEDLGKNLTEKGALLDSTAMFAFRDRALSTLSNSLTYTIWEYTYDRSRTASDNWAEYRQLDYTIRERYMKYLSAVSFIADTNLQKYLEPIEAAGGLSHSSKSGLLINHSLFDLTNERNRLIFAIHCLTLSMPEIPRISQDVLQVQNTTADSVYLEIWSYPAKGYENNRAGAFDAIMPSQQSFTLNFDGLYFSEKDAEISAAYPKYELEGFEIVVYRPLRDEVIIYGGTPKDTLAIRKFSVQEIIEQSPTVTIR